MSPGKGPFPGRHRIASIRRPRDVRFARLYPCFQLLRRHVRRRPVQSHVVSVSCASRWFSLLAVSCGSVVRVFSPDQKSRIFRLAVRSTHHVHRLQVQVDDSVFVRMFQGRADWPSVSQHGFHACRSHERNSDERHPSTKFHGDETARHPLRPIHKSLQCSDGKTKTTMRDSSRKRCGRWDPERFAETET